MMPDGERLVMLVCACAAAFAMGFMLERAWCLRSRKGASYREAYFRDKGLGGEGLSQDVPGAMVLRVAALFSMRKSGDVGTWVRLLPKTARWFDESAGKAGLPRSMTASGACEARVLCGVVGFSAGLLLGLPFSMELSAALGAFGAFSGWRLLAATIERRRKRRADDAERHLPHMLEVVVMGLRSGLSFERSMQAYAEHFDTQLARSCELACQEWRTGFSVRDGALRDLAQSYDSPLVERTVESVIRSLRLGSSLVDDLLAIASDARATYAASRQERAAKAPVKMMVATGTLMLPAMLLLVMGPILLDLMGGFQ